MSSSKEVFSLDSPLSQVPGGPQSSRTDSMCWNLSFATILPSLLSVGTSKPCASVPIGKRKLSLCEAVTAYQRPDHVQRVTVY